MPLFMNVMHLTGSTMGYLVAAFAVAQLIASPLREMGWPLRQKIMILAGLFYSLSELTFDWAMSPFYISQGRWGHQCRFYHARCYSVCRRYYDGAGKIEGDGLCICRHQQGLSSGPAWRIYCRSRRSNAVFLCGGNCIYRSDFLCLYAERAVNKEERAKQMESVKESTFLKIWKSRFIQTTWSPLSSFLFGIRAVGVRNGIQLIYKP